MQASLDGVKLVHSYHKNFGTSLEQRFSMRNSDIDDLLEFEPVAKEMLHEQILGVLKRKMMMGGFAPGQKLPLRALAKSLGTSLMPVRDALQRMESLGVMVTTPARTMMVPVLSEKQQEDITRLRVLLESEAAAKAAMNRTEAELARLASHCAEIRTSAESDDLDLFLKSNYQFHMCIAEASRISFMGLILEPLWMHIGPLVRDYMPSHEHIVRSVSFHEKIYDAIQAMDPERASEAMIEDIVESNRLDLPHSRIRR